jgi:hypothetical protein
MTITPDYRQLHQAVDRLSPAQAEALYVVVESMLGEGSATEPAGAGPDGDSHSGHRLSFTAAGSGPEDLAEHAEDYLRASGFGHPSG